MEIDIAITTVSWIRNKEERKVVLQTIENLSRLKIPIIIVDGGSPKEDKEFIRQLPNISFLEEEGGLTKQLFRSHYHGATIADYLFYLHTDKLDFVKNEVKRMIDYYNNLKNKGMLIPSRTERSVKTYPSFQYTQEKFLNFFISDYLGIKSDYYAGPKIYPSFLVKYLDQVKEDIGWGIVRRYKEVKVKTYDRSGNKIIIHAKGWSSILLQHEIDHLNGILFIDRLPNPQKAHFVKENETQKYRRNFRRWRKFIDVSKWARKI